MSQSEMTRDELVALFAAKATAPPPEANLLLARHLKCEESVHLAGFVSEAMNRYTESSSQRLHVPSQLLPPLG
jgi:hypothetical protein